MRELRRDDETGMALVVDRSDPPRYYLSSRKRVDLLCIGDSTVALESFNERVSKAKTRRKSSPKP